MHVLISDVLTCPRCGPEWPLVVLADRVEERRILEGWLGCANCHQRFPVTAGFADLRGESESTGADATVDTMSAAPSAEDALRTAALLGVTEAPALVLVVGSGAVNSAAVAELVPGIEIVAAWPGLAELPESSGVSRIAIADMLPMRSASMRGVALTDARSESLIEEAARVVMPRGRIAVYNGGAHIASRLEQCGLRLVAQDERTTVAVRVAF